MKNRVWKIIAGIVITLAILMLIATFAIDGMVKSAIENKGSELLQTSVTVNKVDISIFGGTGSLSGLSVENPEGFSDKPALQFDRADIRLQLSSLFSDEIVVHELIIRGPEVFFEQQEARANLKTLNDNFNSSADDSEMALIIDYFLLEDGLISVSTSIDRERSGEATIERFELEGIGRDGNSTVKESLRQILEPLLQRAVREAVEEGVFDQLENRARDLFNQ
ncbi:MAG: hypothetical protein WD016_09990 [Balneolaceae bacterium]